MLKSCSNFCLRCVCFLRKGSILCFEKSGIVAVINDEILGEGGFSTVHKASSKKDPSIKYAVKRVLVQTDDINKAVLAELKSLNTFRHPNMIKLIDSLENRDHSNNRVVFLLFPLMRRGTLRHVLNERIDDPQRKNLDLAKIVGDFKAICLAFNYMHTFTPVSYIHQDIKPEVCRSILQQWFIHRKVHFVIHQPQKIYDRAITNQTIFPSGIQNILISDDGTPLLTDFGSARVAEIFIDSRNKVSWFYPWIVKSICGSFMEYPKMCIPHTNSDPFSAVNCKSCN